LSNENVPDLQQPSTDMQTEVLTPNIKSVLPVHFPRRINVAVIEEKSPAKIGIPENQDLTADTAERVGRRPLTFRLWGGDFLRSVRGRCVLVSVPSSVQQ